MGYYTDFTLAVKGLAANSDPCEITDIPPLMREVLEAEIEEMMVFELGNSTDGYYANAKWYDWEEDMRLLSKRFPNILFRLHGEGENIDDLWNAYFVGGKSQVCYAEIVYGEFDPSQLGGLISDEDAKNARYSYQRE